MPDPQPLLVPLDIDTLIVTKTVRDTTTFRRWTAHFDTLAQHGDPEPDPYSGETAFGPQDEGAYLQWRLPTVLTRANQDEKGVLTFPKIPNRWLAIRYSIQETDAPSAPTVSASRAWIVESDYIDHDKGTSEFATPAAPPSATGIGRNQILDATGQHWSEPHPKARLFLDALGPGIPTFSVYQPYNQDVLSLHDPLDDLDDWQNPQRDATLSYCLLGWYSNPADDPLANPRTSADLLKTLNWNVTAGPDLRNTLLHASVLGLRAAGPAAGQSQSRPQPDDVKIAVGSCMEEALRALQPQPADGDDPDSTLRRLALAALLHDTLEHLGRPDGTARTEQASLLAQFAPDNTARTWSLTLPTAADTAGHPPADARTEDLLNEANDRQQAAEQAARTLDGQRQRLLDLWWLIGKEHPQHPAELDTAFTATLTATEQAHQAGQAAADALATALTRLRTAAATTGHLAVAAPAEPWFTPEDPTILLQGANVAEPLTPPGPLPCRRGDQTVTALPSLSLHAQTTPPGSEHLYTVPADRTAPARAVLAEFALLDQATRAGRLPAVLADPATQVTGTLAAFTTPWLQPWQPLHLMWTTRCVPLPYQEHDHPLWSFDGNHYSWNGDGTQNEYAFAGRTALVPLPGFTLSRLADRHARRTGDHSAAWERLRDAATTADLLSQTMTGLNAWYLQRRPTLRYTPNTTDPDPLTRQTAAYVTRAPQPAAADPDGPVFQPLRAGQFYFKQLSLVDRFGQSIDLIRDNTTPIHTLTRPQHTIHGTQAVQVVELPPRMINPTRLRIDPADPDTDQVPPPSTRPYPRLAGWLLPNHLDRSALLYDPDGVPVVELRRGAQDHDPPATLTLPGTPTANAALTRFRTYLAQFTNTDLDQFLGTIDLARTTMEHTDQDLSSLAALAGRPLALVRVRVGVETASPPPGPTAWDRILTPPDPHVLDQDAWPIRLGDADLTRDGLVGYLLDTTTDTLRTPHPAPGTSPYLTDVTGTDPRLTVPCAPSPLATGRFLTLVVSPWHPVHATSGILPVTALQLPEALVRASTSRLAIPFSTDPLLTPPDPDARSVVMPNPRAWAGTWRWMQRDRTPAHDWTSADHLIQATAQAAFPTGPAAARAGFLQLDHAFAPQPGDPN
ncbi:hypothetical protein [Streptomyces griseus]|uniref:hypothetical protein n=1 Tax=Streptomyces griseus TaxID=1911 RepID=UPI0036B44E82